MNTKEYSEIELKIIGLENEIKELRQAIELLTRSVTEAHKPPLYTCSPTSDHWAGYAFVR